MNDVGAVILAGGKGTRFHQKKQFVKLKGKELWRHVYDKACQIIPKEKIVVVGVDIPGGETRSGSVMNGLNALHDCSKVLLIEAARPLVTVEQLQMLIDTEADSVTFVAPCVDTIIKKDKTYLNRSECLRLQTPQAFNYELLKKAYLTGKYSDMTDETRVLFEEFGIKPTFVEGGENLYKVTYPQDIVFIETVYGQEGAQ
jgi:2-C-methyl-D-erythritol 4-phosphate cytidylyltransferase